MRDRAHPLTVAYTLGPAIVLAGVLVTALLVSGCGKKGPGLAGQNLPPDTSLSLV